MSKVSYTFKINEYICDCLEEIRKMDKTRDYSSLKAVTERIQHHANKMEAALVSRWQIKRTLSDKKLSKKEKLQKIKEIVE